MNRSSISASGKICKSLFGAFAFFVLFAAGFTSCENFLKSEDVKQDIVNTIEYNNAPSYVINVETIDQDKCGKVKTPATGEITKKVSDVFPVRFEPAEGYVFKKWEAVVEGMSTGEKASDYIEFEDSESLETKVTFKKASSKVIKIRPVCPEKLTYTFSPTDGSVNPRDSSIVLTFNKEIDRTSFSNWANGTSDWYADFISISPIEKNKTSADFFKAPKIDGNKITFYADTSKGYIPVSKDSVTVINVNIPASCIHYTYQQGDTIETMQLDAPVEKKYSINSETAGKTKIKYVLMQEDEKPIGIFKADGDETDARVYEYSIGKTVSLRYKLPAGYTFRGWLFKNAQGATVNPEDINLSVSYEDNAETQGYEVLSGIVEMNICIDNYYEGTISVTPVCFENLAITQFNLSDTLKEYERDSDIKLTFNKKFETDCYKNISITIPGLEDGKTFEDYFEVPVLNDKTLVFKAKNETLADLIPVSANTTKSIVITIPADQVYYIKDFEGEDVKVGLASDTTLTYKINTETTKKTKIKFHKDASLVVGSLKIDGLSKDEQTVEYSMGKKIDATYTLTKNELSDYEFNTWKITYTPAGSQEVQTITDLTTVNLSVTSGIVSSSNEASVYGASISIDNYKEGLITIEPVVNWIPQADITIDGEHGKFSPAKKTYSFKQGRSNDIEFEPDSDYEFIYWQLEDKNGDVLDLSNENSGIKFVNFRDEKTSFQVTDASLLQDYELVLKPVVVERPQTISTSPLRSSKGVLRDTTIQVMFDYEMDENSIYYSTEELEAFSVDGFFILPREFIEDKEYTPDINDNIVLGFITSDDTVKYYGYQKDGQLYFKNISIINSNNGANLLNRFKPPVFENSKTLLIPVNRKNPLAAGLNVMVTLDKGFFYKLDQKEIAMSQAKKWVYMVNGETDVNAPTVSKNSTTNKDLFIVKDSAGKEVTPSATAPTINASQISSLHFFKEGEFNLGFKLHDDAAHESTFNVYCKKIYNNSYTSINPATNSVNLSYTTAYGEYAIYGEESTESVSGMKLAPAKLKGLSDGVYGLSFEFKDASGNTLTYPEDGKLYYISLDGTAPNISAPTVTSPSPDAANYTTSLNLAWSYSGYIDYNKAFFEYKKADESSYDEDDKTDEILVGNNTTSITGLEPGECYTIRANYFDVAGNKKDIEKTVYTAPVVPKSVTVTKVSGTSVKLTCTKPDDGNCSSIRVSYRKQGSSNWLSDEKEATVSDVSPTNDITISGLEEGFIYDFRVRSYYADARKYSADYNVSSAYPNFRTVPNPPSSVSADFTTSTTQGTFTWTAPSSGNYSGYILYCSTSADFAEGTVKSKVCTNSSATTDTITGLSPATYYYYKVAAYYGPQDNAAELVPQNNYTWTRTSPVTDFALTSRTNNSLTFSWTKPVGNYDRYYLYYKLHSAGAYSSTSLSKSSTSYTLTGLTGGEKYDIIIKAYRYNLSDAAQSASDGWQCLPNAATNLNTQKESNTSFTVTWTAPAGQYDGYNLYYSTTEAGVSSATPIAISKGQTSYPATGLVSRGFYYLKLETYCGSSASSSQRLKTYSDFAYCSLKIDAVTNLTATPTATSKIKLTWTNPSSTGYDGVRIYRDDTKIADISKGTAEYEDTGRSTNTSYTYKVETYKTENGETFATYATKIGKTYSALATNVKGVSTAPGSVTISWTNPSNSNYDIVYVYCGSTWKASFTDKTTTSCTVDGLAGGTSYTFSVRTSNGNVVNPGYDDYSEISSYTMPSPVTNLKWDTASTTQTSVKLTWTKPSDTYTGLKIYYRVNGSSSWTLKTSLTNNTSTSYEVTGLTASTFYDFRVDTYYNNVSNYSSYEYPICRSAVTRCKPVTGVSLTSRTTNSLTVGWTLPTETYDTVWLYYKKSSDSVSNYTKVAPGFGKTSYTLSNLSTGVSYDIYLASYYYSSNYMSYGTAAGTGPSNPLKKTTMPDKPTGFTVTASSDYGTYLSWTAPTSGSITGYQVHYSPTGSGNWTSFNTSDTSCTFTNTGLLTNGIQYDFYVNTYYTVNGETVVSYNSDHKYYYTPPKAISLTPTLWADDGMGTFTIKWTNPSGRSDLTGLDVYLDSKDTPIKSVSFSSGEVGKVVLNVKDVYSSYDSYYNISFQPYHFKNGDITFGPKSSKTKIYTTQGNLCVNGVTYSKTSLNNVVTSSTYTTVSNNTVRTGGAFPKDRTVKLSKYSIGAYEVTTQLYCAVWGSSTDSLKPASSVSWYDAMAFCNKLSVLQGLKPYYTISGITESDWKNKSLSYSTSNSNYIKVPLSEDSSWSNATFNTSANGYRLPTEAQWEFAARGGSMSAPEWNYDYSGDTSVETVGWVSSNSGGASHEVGTKTSNRLGLYDMTGNVWEWLTDWNYSVPTGTWTDPYCSHTSVSNSSATPSTLKHNDKEGVLIKGASWDSSKNRQIDYNSQQLKPWEYDSYTGFRLCRNQVR